MKNNYIIYFSLLILIACTTRNKENTIVDKISVNEKDIIKQEVNLSHIINKIEIIPLETSTESLIGNFHKVVELKEGFLVLDFPGRDRILQFGKGGNFIKTIGSAGHAPQEYISIADFDYDDKTEELYILDNGRRLSIKKYDLKTGNYLGDLLYKDAYGTQFKKIADGNWAVAGITDQEPFAFFSADSSFKKILNKDIVLKPYFDAFIIPEMFSESGDKILFRVGVNDTIYEIKDNRLKPYLYVDFEKKITDEMYEKEFNKISPQDVMALSLKIDGMHQIYTFLENTNHTYFNFFNSGQLTYTFLNRKTEKKLIIPSKLLINDFIRSKVNNFNLRSLSYDKKSFIGVIRPYDIDKKKLSSDLMGDKIYQQLMKLSENDNPVIVKYYLSDFYD